MLWSDAFAFADAAHMGQTRKYSDEPYVHHCLRVAKMVSEVQPDAPITCAAVLHDTIEDCDVTFEQLWIRFGYEIARLVLEVSEFSNGRDGNRATRKALDRRYLARVSPDAQTIKIADLIDNTADILKHDCEFARVYVREKALLLPLLKYGNRTLRERAERQLYEAEKELLQ